MSWMEQLVQTYDENKRFAGRDDVDGMRALLPPVGHIVQNAQIEMTLSADGELIQAEVIPKELQSTLIPCTPESASRTNRPSPHPLHDNLSYVARDYYDFAKKPPKGETVPYLLYRKLLGTWADSDTNSKVQAVYRYISSHDVIRDLIEKKVLYQDDTGKLIEKWTDKEAPKPAIFSAVPGDILKAMVRFRVVVVKCFLNEGFVAGGNAVAVFSVAVRLGKNKRFGNCAQLGIDKSFYPLLLFLRRQKQIACRENCIG